MKKLVNGKEVECSAEEAAAIQAEWDAWEPPLPPLARWQEERKRLYRERIATYKGRPNASYDDVIGFVLDPIIATVMELAGKQGVSPGELGEIAAIVQKVKTDVPSE